MNKRKLGPCVTFFPQPTTLISTVDSDGKADIMTASWAGIVSKTPPTMGVSFNRTRKSYENLCQSGYFVVNVVPAQYAIEADYCGLKSGRDEDKFEVAGFSTTEASEVNAPLVLECPLNIECKVTGEQEIGDYRLVFGEIVEIHAAEAGFREDGSMDTHAFDPLVYLGGIREYWDLGQRKAAAYSDGKKLFR